MYLCKVAGSIHMFKIKDRLTPDSIRFKKIYVWDILEIDWREVRVTLNENEINLPTSVSYHLEINLRLENYQKTTPTTACDVETRENMVYLRK